MHPICFFVVKLYVVKDNWTFTTLVDFHICAKGRMEVNMKIWKFSNYAFSRTDNPILSKELKLQNPKIEIGYESQSFLSELYFRMLNSKSKWTKSGEPEDILGNHALSANCGSDLGQSPQSSKKITRPPSNLKIVSKVWFYDGSNFQDYIEQGPVCN